MYVIYIDMSESEADNMSNSITTFYNMQTRLQTDGYNIPQLELEDIIGTMLNSTHFSEIIANIPNSNEFYTQLCENINNIGFGANPTQNSAANQSQLPVNFVTTFMYTFPFGENTSQQPDGEYPLKQWFTNPEKLAEAMINEPEKAESFIQSFVTRYASSYDIIGILSEIFNKIDFKHELRQNPEKDIITKAIKNSGLNITRGDFKRDTDSFSQVMCHSDANIKYVLKTEQCHICAETIEPLQIETQTSKKKNIYIAYNPYDCKHIFCRQCYYGLQLSATGDYCPYCRAKFNNKT